MDEASSQGDMVPLRQDGFQIVPPLLLIPSCGGQRADLGEKREPRETVYDNCRKVNEQWRRSLTRHHRDREVSLGQLAQEQRQVILLVGLEEFSYEETAVILKVPVGTVRSRLSRGRDHLRRLLDMPERAPAVTETAGPLHQAA
jgi:hypothetical protein